MGDLRQIELVYVRGKRLSRSMRGRIRNWSNLGGEVHRIGMGPLVERTRNLSG
jgi:hypothetical protein